VQREINELKQERTDEHPGQTRRQREATISRLLARNDSLEGQNQQLREQLAAQRPQDQPAHHGQAQRKTPRNSRPQKRKVSPPRQVRNRPDFPSSGSKLTPHAAQTGAESGLETPQKSKPSRQSST
jgi:hypothetical protein